MHKDNSSALIVEYLCHLYMERAKKLRLEKLEAWGKLEVTKTYHFEVFFLRPTNLCVRPLEGSNGKGRIQQLTQQKELNKSVVIGFVGNR